MKNRIMRTISMIVLAMMMVINGVAGTFTVRAATMSDTNGVVNFGRGEAKITITGNEGQSLVGKTFHIYKLFCAENSVGMESINYSFNPEFQVILQRIVGGKKCKDVEKVTEYEVIDYVQSLNKNQVEGAVAEQETEGSYSEFRYFVEELRSEIVSAGIVGDIVNVTSTRADNSVSVEGLEYGYYIVDESTSVKETHSAAALCMVTTAAPEAKLHIKSDYPSLIQKIQEDDDKTTVGNDGWNDIADYEIGQVVPYKCESNIPDINGYDDYYYAWHGVLDEALTFQEDSVEITIYETSDSTSRSYTLNADEVRMGENPNDEDTFVIAIKDIKWIVDREFNESNSMEQNVYGQRVVLTYNAILNDKAAMETGRSGFEQDVRLEFSNDADENNSWSRGYTPWDTTVCFTYKLNVKKANNHGVQLENAKFRLYSDEECKQEVLVKETENGYVVMNGATTGGVEMVSGSEGAFTIFGLDDGIYYLKETEAPIGYRKLLDAIKIALTSAMNTDRNHYVKGDGSTEKALRELTAFAYVKEFLSGKYTESDTKLTADVEEGAANITVVNTAGTKLPVTGSVLMLILAALGIAILFIVASKKDKQGRA